MPMKSPYGLQIIENCLTCKLRADRLFCDLSNEALKSFEQITSSILYPKGSVLFVEGQPARGIFVLCTGRAKLSTSSSEGKTLIVQVAEPGELLGLSATVSGKSYEVTAEMLEPSQVNFVRRDDFLHFLTKHTDACLRVAQQLSANYHTAYEQVRSIGLSHSASQKLAMLLLDWGTKHCSAKTPDRMTMDLTHEEIAQLIGSSRETVTRLFTEFKQKGVVEVRGATLHIRDRKALEGMAAC